LPAITKVKEPSVTDTKPSIDQPVDSVDRSGLAGQARISAWSHGAQALTLLAAAHERGWLMFLRRPRTPAELATFTGMEDARLAAVVGALEASGVVRRVGGSIELRPEFVGLVADDGLYRGMLDALPEFASAIGSGRLLDVGCGVAGAMLTAASMFPGMTGVGLEVEPFVAAEAQRRAAKFGDRIRIITTDARDFDEAEGFDVCFWAQPFFPVDTRADTLRMIWRALKPGGVLIEQEMEVDPQDEGARLGFALRRLVFAGWNVPFARTAEVLGTEATAEGFQHVRIATTSLGRVVVSRRP
jgi:SAM-dependent methyltransferase